MYRLVILIFLIFPIDALACSNNPGWFQPSFDRVNPDTDIPPVFQFNVENIRRGQGPTPQKDGIYMSSSCDDIGSIRINVESKNDEDPCEYGFYIYDTTNSAPLGLIPRNPIQPRKNGGECILTLSWIDGASWVQDQINLVLEFEAVNNLLFKGDRSLGLKVFHDGPQKSPVND